MPDEFYFRLDNQPSFIFSRNLGANYEDYYGSFLDWSVAGGTLMVRLPLDCFGVGITSSGEIDEVWALKWERIFDRAAAKGLYVLPILTGWVQWDPSLPYSSWPSNQLNAVNGGPVEDPLELFQAGSETQEIWLAWMETLVERWRGRTNILAWEIFSEVNCGTALEADGIDFINTAASRIRAVDPGRLITASRCESGSWPNFYAQADIDFVQVHPYPVTRSVGPQHPESGPPGPDQRIIMPVMIGESGLHFVRPDFEEGKMTVAENAERGVRHAIWAGIVSGAMNGRALWWEDSFGIYFPELSMGWLKQYSTMELPAVNFVQRDRFLRLPAIDLHLFARRLGRGSGKRVHGARLVPGCRQRATRLERPDHPRRENGNDHHPGNSRKLAGRFLRHQYRYDDPLLDLRHPPGQHRHRDPARIPG